MLFNTYRTMFNIPTTSLPFPWFGFGIALIITAFAVSVAVITLWVAVRHKPSELLRGRAPRTGGRILLERIPFLWRILPFRYKSTMRNIFRYRVRFFMTVFSMMFSTALVFCGMSLIFAIEGTMPEMAETVRPITAFIVLAAIALNSMIIFNITSINIDERRREIATLKVMGYRNTEVVGYVFREIFFLTIIGVLIGLPIGLGLIYYIFEYLNFIPGSLELVDWYVWIITMVLSFAALGLADLLLFRKIHRTDMNGSLKVND